MLERSEFLGPGRRQIVWVAIVLAALTLLFWKVRIIDSAVHERPSLYTGDLYAQHYPMTDYAFRVLRAGRLPLWNPYQMCGAPLLAVPYVGLFYPLNLVYLFFDTAAGIEVSFALHMLLGALGMWGLMRHFGVGMLGALCSAVTFMWSGWLIFNANQPSLFAPLAWAPLTVLLADRLALGRRYAGPVFSVAVACQVLIGQIEIFLHTMYAAAIFVGFRILQHAWRESWKAAARRAGIVLLCVLAGVLLAAVQLAPSLELVRQSVRSAGRLTFAEVTFASLPPFHLLLGALGSRAHQALTAGLLPWLGIFLVLGWRRHRFVWISALTVGAVGILLASGGPVFRLYYATPVGDLFRRPVKFVDMHSFAQAVLVGVAVARLESWSGVARRRLWLHPGWLAALALGLVGLGVPALLDTFTPYPYPFARRGLETPNLYLVGLLALMILFATVTSARLRLAAVVGMCAIQAATLFWNSASLNKRPWQQPEVFGRYAEMMQYLKGLGEHERAYLFPGWTEFGLSAKSGMLAGVNLAVDHEPLALGRYAAFFDGLSGRRPDRPFGGSYMLGRQSRWRLMALTGTKFFVTRRGTQIDRSMAARVPFRDGPRFRMVHDGEFRVYENEQAVPRAYFVRRASVVANPAAALAALEDPRFAWRGQVILEERPRRPTPKRLMPLPLSTVSITTYEAERVAVAVSATSGGYLVLTDVYYPGWKAFVDGRETRVYRANYLFRAVWVPRGEHEVRFEYRPDSFRQGVGLSAAVLLAIAAATLATWIRPRLRGVSA